MRNSPVGCVRNWPPSPLLPEVSEYGIRDLLSLSDASGIGHSALLPEESVLYV
jgi:hypothetical protein